MYKSLEAGMTKSRVHLDLHRSPQTSTSLHKGARMPYKQASAPPLLYTSTWPISPHHARAPLRSVRPLYRMHSPPRDVRHTCTCPLHAPLMIVPPYICLYPSLSFHFSSALHMSVQLLLAAACYVRSGSSKGPKPTLSQRVTCRQF